MSEEIKKCTIVLIYKKGSKTIYDDCQRIQLILNCIDQQIFIDRSYITAGVYILNLFVICCKMNAINAGVEFGENM